MEYPDVIYATERVGSNGINCLDYKNLSDDVKYVRADLVKFQNKSSNSDYMSALIVIKEWAESKSILPLEAYINERLNQQS